MRSRRYSIKLDRVRKILTVDVYADRSVDMWMTDTRTDETTPRPSHLQTRANAADTLNLARFLGQPIERTWL